MFSLKAWKVHVPSLPGHPIALVFASTRGKAISLYRGSSVAGNQVKFSDYRASRAPEYDELATSPRVEGLVENVVPSAINSKSVESDELQNLTQSITHRSAVQIESDVTAQTPIDSSILEVVEGVDMNFIEANLASQPKYQSDLLAKCSVPRKYFDPTDESDMVAYAIFRKTGRWVKFFHVEEPFTNVPSTVENKLLDAYLKKVDHKVVQYVSEHKNKA